MTFAEKCSAAFGRDGVQPCGLPWPTFVPAFVKNKAPPKNEDRGNSAQHESCARSLECETAGERVKISRGNFSAAVCLLTGFPFLPSFHLSLFVLWTFVHLVKKNLARSGFWFKPRQQFDRGQSLFLTLGARDEKKITPGLWERFKTFRTFFRVISLMPFMDNSDKARGKLLGETSAPSGLVVARSLFLNESSQPCGTI